MSLENLEQPKASHEKLLSLEDIEKMKVQYEQEKMALRDGNEKYLKKANKVENEEMRKLVMARLGLISVRLAELDQNVMVSLN
ncbi:MAG: hypothetical protein WC726_01420 [Parcubacteria group bacterium]|jgi:hypothetical protein